MANSTFIETLRSVVDDAFIEDVKTKFTIDDDDTVTGVIDAFLDRVLAPKRKSRSGKEPEKTTKGVRRTKKETGINGYTLFISEEMERTGEPITSVSRKWKGVLTEEQREEYNQRAKDLAPGEFEARRAKKLAEKKAAKRASTTPAKAEKPEAEDVSEDEEMADVDTEGGDDAEGDKSEDPDAIPEKIEKEKNKKAVEETLKEMEEDVEDDQPLKKTTQRKNRTPHK